MSNKELHPLTEIINKNQKNKSHLLRQAALRWLSKQFPQAFDNTMRIRPLKKGIIHDILKHSLDSEISKSKLREAVGLYTSRIDYLTCLKVREPRIDLQGSIVEEVSTEEAQKAALKIKRKVERNIKELRKSTVKVKSADFTYQQSQSTTAPDAPAIVVKTPKTIDPKAVARLKEKLGLAKRGLIPEN